MAEPMVRKRSSGDLKVAYRPYRIDEVIGHDNIKKMVSNAIENDTFPHASLFIGPKGCGKTTFARIVALSLNCEKGVSSNPCGVCDTCKSIIRMNNMAVRELDGTMAGNIDTIKELVKDLPYAALGGERFKVLIIDEAHMLTDKGESALLKPLEDTPDHVYIILCTNEPKKLKDTIRDRCKAGTIQFSRLEDKYIYTLMRQVAEFEGMDYNPDVLQYLVGESEGTPRTALGVLQKVNNEGSWTLEKAKALVSLGLDADEIEVYEFCKVLLNSGFKDSIKMFATLKKIPPETVRISMMGFFAGCLRNAKTIIDADKFSDVLDIITSPCYGPKPEHILTHYIYKVTKILRG